MAHNNSDIDFIRNKTTGETMTNEGGHICAFVWTIFFIFFLNKYSIFFKHFVPPLGVYPVSWVCLQQC